MNTCQRICSASQQARLARPLPCVRLPCVDRVCGARPPLISRGLFLRQHHIRGAVLQASSAAAAALQDEQSVVGRIKRRLTKALCSEHDKEIFAVAIPAFIGLALEPLVNAVNAGLVGHLGTQQLSAVSIGSIALNAAIFLFSFLLFLTVPEVAAAVVKNDEEEVSRVTAQSLWVAAGCGCITAAAVGLNAANIVAALRPPEAVVAAMATQYIQIRSLGIPAALLGFVATGVFRGFKDTRTPLAGTAASVALSLCSHLLLLNVLHMGVLGAALASTAASLASSALLVGALIARRKVRPRHLTDPPPLRAVLPLLQRGFMLGAKNMVTFGMILFASTLCARRGSAFQASFEVLRQLWMITMPFFECASVAAQALCATALGQQDVRTAALLLRRLLVLGTCVGGCAGAVVWLLHPALIAVFTRDTAVVQLVMSALPLICIFFAIDAAGSIMDGSLLAAKQSTYMSAVQIAGSVVQYFALLYIASSGNVGTFSVWAVIKVMPVFRLFGGGWRNFVSARSAYLEPNTANSCNSSSSETNDSYSIDNSSTSTTSANAPIGHAGSSDSSSHITQNGVEAYHQQHPHQQQRMTHGSAPSSSAPAPATAAPTIPVPTAAAAAATAAATAAAADAAAAAVAAAAASAAMCSGGDGAVGEVEMAVAAALVDTGVMTSAPPPSPPPLPSSPLPAASPQSSASSAAGAAGVGASAAPAG
ncbi:hypothetical protein Agub_g2395 [Astrephomene gubernaculifera]|uniref:Protein DETOXIFICATION n=1 Tax=Astrephomene gubernaculifera TaxID=47775 RepID=A0AAD3DHH8_9CHLO|nr:hypothetical protein Agub_g2395 [Astrephomene gubernaculifera]